MKTITHFILAIFTISATYSQVGINTDNSAPHSSAQLDVKSTTKAFYPPRMTTAQKNAIASPQAGAVVFDNTLNQLSFYNGTAWVAAAGSVLTLPYNQSLNLATPNLSGIFTIGNYYTDSQANAIIGNTYSADGNGVIGQNYAENGEFGAGVAGIHFGTGIGIIGNSILGTGVFGKGKIKGVYGESDSGAGGFFKSTGDGYALITDVGNVGIGTLTPTSKMDIQGSENLSQFYFGSNENTFLRGGKSTSHVIINDTGDKIGLGTSPVLRGEEKVDINGRLRIRSSTAGTAGVWFNNTGNSISTANGAFHGMVNDTETGIWIGNAWRFWVNANGNVTSTSLAGVGTRPVYANNSGTLTATPTNQTLTLQPSDFQSISGYSTLYRYPVNLNFSGIGSLVAAVKLPVGAVINNIVMRALDTKTDGQILYSLEKVGTNTNIGTFISSGGSTIFGSNASPINTSSTNNLPHTITSNRYYYITISAFNSSANYISWNSGLDFDLRWIEIEYTY